jgi:hypothetical protein
LNVSINIPGFVCDFQIHKLGQLLLEVDVKTPVGPERCLATMISAMWGTRCPVVHVIPIDEQHHVRVLLNTARLTKVTKHRALSARDSTWRESWLRARMGTFNSRAALDGAGNEADFLLAVLVIGAAALSCR